MIVLQFLKNLELKELAICHVDSPMTLLRCKFSYMERRYLSIYLSIYLFFVCLFLSASLRKVISFTLNDKRLSESNLSIYLSIYLSQPVNQLSQLGLQNTSTASLPGIRPQNKYLGYNIKLSNTGVLENAEYPFIAITPRFTLVRSGNTWNGPIYGLNRTIWHLNWVQINDLC